MGKLGPVFFFKRSCMCKKHGSYSCHPCTEGGGWVPFLLKLWRQGPPQTALRPLVLDSGTPAAMSQVAKDVCTFLRWAARQNTTIANAWGSR